MLAPARRTCNSCAGARALAHRFHYLENLGSDLSELVEAQRESFRKPGDGEQPAAMDAAPPSAGEAEPAPRAEGDGRPPDPAVPEPIARFVPSEQWRRHSDYVAHLAKKFEEGIVDKASDTRCASCGTGDERGGAARSLRNYLNAHSPKSEEDSWAHRKFMMYRRLRPTCGVPAVAQGSLPQGRSSRVCYLHLSVSRTLGNKTELCLFFCLF